MAGEGREEEPPGGDDALDHVRLLLVEAGEGQRIELRQGLGAQRLQPPARDLGRRAADLELIETLPEGGLRGGMERLPLRLARGAAREDRLQRMAALLSMPSRDASGQRSRQAPTKARASAAASAPAIVRIRPWSSAVSRGGPP